MNELLPGIFHWRVPHPDIQIDVDSYYVSALEPAILLDPLEPPEGVEWFRKRPAPAHIYLTNRLHDRHCQRFIEAFGVSVWCHEAGMHEFAGGSLKVTAYRHDNELPGGVCALEVGVLCPEETALLIPTAGGVLLIGDAVINEEGHLGFVPDSLIGDDPPAIKRGLKAALLRICDQEAFDHLLFAHGDPIIGGGRNALRTFCQR